MFERTGMDFPFLYTPKVAQNNINFNHFEAPLGPLNFTKNDKLNEAMAIYGKQKWLHDDQMSAQSVNIDL